MKMSGTSNMVKGVVTGMVIGTAAGMIYGKVSDCMPRKNKMMKKAEKALKTAGAVMHAMTQMF